MSEISLPDSAKTCRNLRVLKGLCELPDGGSLRIETRSIAGCHSLNRVVSEWWLLLGGRLTMKNMAGKRN